MLPEDYAAAESMLQHSRCARDYTMGTLAMPHALTASTRDTSLHSRSDLLQAQSSRQHGSAAQTPNQSSMASTAAAGLIKSDSSIEIATSSTIARHSDRSQSQTHQDDQTDGATQSQSPGLSIEAKPAWADQKTKAGKDRRRLPLACITCRQKKIKCSGEKPSCQHCSQGNLTCLYKESSRRKSLGQADRIAMLDKRLQRVKARVDSLPPSPRSLDNSVEGNTSSGTTPESTEIPGPFHSGVNLAGSPEHLGPSKRKRALVSAGQDSQSTSKIPKAECGNARDHLPPMELQVHLAEVYFDWLYGQPYYLFHRPTFFQKLRAGTLPPIVVLSVCAVAARFSDRVDLTTEPACVRGETWAAPAREMILRNFDDPNIATVAVYLLLGLHEFGACQGGRSWMLAGMAGRMAFALQLHKEVSEEKQGGNQQSKHCELSVTGRELRRRIMWSCLIMDRFTASGTERPMFLQEEDIQIQLPVSESKFQEEIPRTRSGVDVDKKSPTGMGMQGQTSCADDGVPAFLVRLILLWGRVIKHINLGGKERDTMPPWSSESGYGSLRKEIFELEQGLPGSLQNNSSNLQAHSSQNIANQFIFMHITIQQIKLFLYRTFCSAMPGLPCKAYDGNVPPAFQAEAGHAVVDAADQISSLLVVAMQHRAVAPFVGYSAFLSSTVHIWTLRPSATIKKSTVLRSLAANIRYLNQIRRCWGIFNFMAGNLRDIYRRTLCSPVDPKGKGKPASVLQFGDWFAIYPQGKLRDDLQDQSSGLETAPRQDTSTKLRGDIQTIEEFFQERMMQDGNRSSEETSSYHAMRSSTTTPCAPNNLTSPGLANLPPIISSSPAASSINGNSTPAISEAAMTAHAPGQSTYVNEIMQSSMQNPLSEFAFDQASQAAFLPQLDRYVVNNAYANTIPSAESPSFISSHLLSQPGPPNLPPQSVPPEYTSSPPSWNDLNTIPLNAAPLVMAGDPAMSNNFDEVNTSAWFMPFNMHIV